MQPKNMQKKMKCCSSIVFFLHGFLETNVFVKNSAIATYLQLLKNLLGSCKVLQVLEGCVGKMFSLLPCDKWLASHKQGRQQNWIQELHQEYANRHPAKQFNIKGKFELFFFYLLSPEVQVRAAQSEPSSDFPVGQRNCGVFRSVSTFQ